MISLKKLFTPVRSIDAEQLRMFLEEKAPGSYNLLDVRQSHEYEQSHISGARLTPLPQLGDAIAGIDPEKPTVVYCAVGGRSRVAAQLLTGRGFKNVLNLSGGIKAWDGYQATGPRELNLELITGNESPAEIIAIAFQMEEGLGRFYRSARGQVTDSELTALLTRLADIEDRHKTAVLAMVPAFDAHDPRLKKLPAHLLEGGFDSRSLLEENKAFLRQTSDVLDLAMMLEAQAMDLYMRFAEKSTDPTAREILFKIASEEKAHLASLGRLYDRQH